jgi:hypothetical protein
MVEAGERHGGGSCTGVSGSVCPVTRTRLLIAPDFVTTVRLPRDRWPAS